MLIFIVENGLGAVDEVTEDHKIYDQYRILYIREHILQMEKSIEEDGVNIIGYDVWGPLDLISFSTGEMKKRYGLIYFDRNNKGKGSNKRIYKDSFYWYKELISSNRKKLN